MWVYKRGNKENRRPLQFIFEMQMKSLALFFNKARFKSLFLRHKSEQDHSDVCHGMKRAKEMLDKDSVFFWRLFQDIFKTSTINFTGISSVTLLVIDNFPRITGHTKCQQFCEREDHLQKGFRLYSLQVNIASPWNRSFYRLQTAP